MNRSTLLQFALALLCLCALVSSQTSTSDAIEDGGFESGGNYWSYSSDPSPLCDEQICSGQPHSGAYWMHFGGEKAPYNGWLEQVVRIPPNTTSAVLGYYLLVTKLNTGSMTITVDSEQVYSLTPAVNYTNNGAYNWYSVDITSLTQYSQNFTEVTLEFTVSYDGNSNSWLDLSLDDVSVTCVSDDGSGAAALTATFLLSVLLVVVSMFSL